MSLLWIFIGIGGTIGGFIPSLFGQDWTSPWGVLTALLGSVAGIWFYKRLDLE